MFGGGNEKLVGMPVQEKEDGRGANWQKLEGTFWSAAATSDNGSVWGGGGQRRRRWLLPAAGRCSHSAAASSQSQQSPPPLTPLMLEGAAAGEMAPPLGQQTSPLWPLLEEEEASSA
jgi:hypothetical protein